MNNTDTKNCTCVIDPNTEKDHNCDVNGCSSINHYRKGCRCDDAPKRGFHDNSECKYCSDSIAGDKEKTYVQKMAGLFADVGEGKSPTIAFEKSVEIIKSERAKAKEEILELVRDILYIIYIIAALFVILFSVGFVMNNFAGQ